MALPKIKHPQFPVIQPSTQNKVFIRPFTVKEEKILLMAAADEDSQLDLVKQVLANCITSSEVDVDKLPMFDIEYFFIKLRALSVNNVVDFSIKDSMDGEDYPISLDLNAVEVVRKPEHTNKIIVDENVGFTLRYPTVTTYEAIKGKADNIKAMFDVLASCIDIIYEGDKLFKAGVDFTPAEAEDFLESLPAETFTKVQNFFETMPSLRYVVKYTRKDGSEAEHIVEGMASFFR